MVSESSAECSGQLASQEESALAGVLMEVASESVSLFAVESSEVTSDVFADAFDFGELACRAGRGLGVAESAEFFAEFVDVGTDSGRVAVSDLLVDFLFYHNKY